MKYRELIKSLESKDETELVRLFYAFNNIYRSPASGLPAIPQGVKKRQMQRAVLKVLKGRGR